MRFFGLKYSFSDFLIRFSFLRFSGSFLLFSIFLFLVLSISLVFSWNQKLPLVSSSLESTWLCHEIGRCHLELGNNQSAKEFGNKSLVAGKDCEDTVWQLNATVLIAQSEGERSLTLFSLRTHNTRI